MPHKRKKIKAPSKKCESILNDALEYRTNEKILVITTNMGKGFKYLLNTNEFCRQSR